MPAFVHEARVLDYNLNNWTVDVRTQFDNKFFGDIQVSSPYMHPNRGEGMYAMPEVNSKCLVCIPSDGPPPFIMGFIMPQEQKDEPDEVAADGAGGMGPSTFSGGRPRAKPGDIFLKGRDGQYVVLHRGGVLQIGSSELAQRIYIPLNNIVSDVSQNYEHHNTAGNIQWGISSSPQDENPQTQFVQTFRVSANDEKADVRVAVGRVRQPTLEPAGDAGEASQNAGFGLGQGSDNPIVYEVAIAPQGFKAEGGEPSAAQNITTLKFVFDMDGNGFLRAEGNINVRIKKKLRVAVDGDVEFTTKGNMVVEADGTARIVGKSGVKIIAPSGTISMQSGGTPVAAVGSAVDVVIATQIPVTVTIPGAPPVVAPGFILPGPLSKMTGFVVTGSSKVLVPRPG